MHTTIADRREEQALVLTGADFHRARMRSTAEELLRSLAASDIGEIVAIMTDAERRRLRESVGRLNAALDELNVVIRFPDKLN